MNAVASDDDIAFNDCAVGERNAGTVVILCEARATVAGVHHLDIQCARKQFDKISAMHSECGVPAGRVSNLDRRDWSPVMAKVLRAGANPRSPFLDQRSQSDPLQLAYAVWRYEYACSHLTEGRGLLIDGYPQALRDKRVRCEQSAYAAADNQSVQSRICHRAPWLECIPATLV